MIFNDLSENQVKEKGSLNVKNTVSYDWDPCNPSTVTGSL